MTTEDNAVTAQPRLTITMDNYLGLKQRQLEWAAEMLGRVLHNSDPQLRANWVVVMDIDETVLVANKGATHNGQPAYGMAVPGALALFNMVRAAGVPVMFITARHTIARDVTLQQLRALGFGDHAGLALQQWEKHRCSALWKRAVRAQLSRSKLIIAAIGDQVADVDTHAVLPFLLINPRDMYRCNIPKCPCGLQTRAQVARAMRKLLPNPKSAN